MESPTIIDVAYADDHMIIRQGICALVNNDTINISIQAGNGRELINKLYQVKTLPDLCMIDINMPVMNGFETVAAIRKEWPTMRILILSAFYTEFNVLNMIQLGVNGYLTKSSDLNELRKAIISINEIGFYYSDVAPKKTFLGVRNKEIRTPQLTAKESLLLQYICTDLSYAQSAEKVNTTARSVEGYRDSLFKKFNVKSRVGLALLSYQLGFLYATPIA